MKCRQSSFLVRTFKGAGHVACELRAAARIILREMWSEWKVEVLCPKPPRPSVMCYSALLRHLHIPHTSKSWESVSMGATCSGLVPQSPPFLQCPHSKSPPRD